MTYTEAAELLKCQDNILILTHRRPDGDTVGCAVGLCAALRELGKTAWVLPNADTTSLLTPYLEGYLAPDGFAPDFVVSVDIASRGLFPDNAKCWLENGVDLAIDHHGSNEGFGRENCVDPGRAACGELIYDIVRQWGPVSPTAALPLYLAVSTDTGCFVYSNTTAGTHRVAAGLLDTGIDYRSVNKRHFRTKSFKRLRLESMLTEGMDLFDNGTIAIAAVTLDMMKALDAHERTPRTSPPSPDRLRAWRPLSPSGSCVPASASSPSAPPPDSTPRRYAHCWGAAATPLPPGAR